MDAREVVAQEIQRVRGDVIFRLDISGLNGYWTAVLFRITALTGGLDAAQHHRRQRTS